ncbi:MAG TPA: DUF3014 domain-containing protein [Anaeromyxobacter sp.]|nr:DUF3014 domain-containing protein [Anaeromyxobacter sp.]
MADNETEKRSLSRGEWAAVILAAVVVAVAAWVLLRKPEPPPAQPQQTAEVVAPPAQADAPAAQVNDADARAELEKLGTDPAYRRWLAQADDLVRRWAVVTDNLDRGESPRKALEVLAPKGSFQVVQRGAKSYVAPSSYARYDEFAGAVDSIDVTTLAGVYRTLHPALEAAYRALGYPGGSLDAATARALRRLEGAPIADGDVEVIPDGGVFVYADPKLEGLGQVEKHLLRMGPDNERRIQAKARAVREALGLGTEPAAAK